MALYGSPDLTGQYLHMDPDEIIVTKTDLTGKILYGNRTFFKFAGYSESEAIGKQHNIVRHPEMPRAVFALLWRTIAAGEEIFAFVNNRSKSGDSYWVLAHVTPSRDSNGTITGYHSNRRAPDMKIVDQHISPLYADLLAMEKQAGSPKQGLEQAVAKVDGMLAERSSGFNQLMFSLGI